MKAEIQVSPHLVISVEAEEQKKLFKEIAVAQEVFGENRCNKCQSTDLRFVVRTVDGNDFYELHCRNKECKARFSFGSHRQNETLFPKKKDQDGNWIANNGWLRWDKDKKKMV